MFIFGCVLAGIGAGVVLMAVLVRVPLCSFCDDGSCVACQEDALASPGEECAS